METVQRLGGSARDGFLEDRVESWAEKACAAVRAEALQAGRARARGRLVHMAELKFDADTAGRLERLLENTDDEALLDEVGSCIITCQTGDDLLAQVSKGA